MVSRKSIFILVNNNFFARNFLRTEAFETLSSRSDVRIVLLIPAAKLDYYRNEFESENVVIDILPDVRKSYMENFFQLAEQASIVTHRTHMDKMTALFRKSDTGGRFQIFRRLPIFLVKSVFRTFGRIGRPWRNFIRKLYYFYPGKHFESLIEKYQPDLVFCPTMVLNEDYCLLREAKKRGIPSIGFVFSWDAFYSKTFLRLHPDFLVVQNDIIKEQAARMGDYPQDKINTVGILQYDIYFKKDKPFLKSREEFISGLGGDPKKKFLLYAFSGKAGFHIDFDIVDILYNAISNKEIGSDVNVFLRPYPKMDFSEEKMKRMQKQYDFLVHPTTIPIGEKHTDWEMNKESLFLLANSLFHADIVITMYSTFFIEAAIFNKPLIAIGFDGYKKFNYWNSARRFFDWDHFLEIKPANAIWYTRDKGEFVKAINTYLGKPEYMQEGRKKIVKEQCQYLDGNSGKRLADILLNKLCL